MTVKRSDVEIMAPVGCYESLAAAVQAGADSIYFGVEQLNMRARSSFNFTLDDLSRIVSEAGRHGDQDLPDRQYDPLRRGFARDAPDHGPGPGARGSMP